MNSIEIRKAISGDEKILAHIQTEAWKSAFGEILSKEDLIEYTNLERNEEMYANVLANNYANGSILSVDGKEHCIAFWSKSREKEEQNKAELICIHSLQNNWGKGYGLAMMSHLLDEIREAGYVEVILWVFEKNMRARKFYEKLGFKLTDKRKDSFYAVEVMYSKVL